MQMHLDLHHIDWRDDLVYPLALIAVPIVISAFGPGGVLTLAFPVAVVAGYMFAPRHLWLVWLASVALMWASYGSAVLLDVLPSPSEDPSSGETIWSFAAESFVFMAGLVWLPLTIGRLLKRAVG